VGEVEQEVSIPPVERTLIVVKPDATAKGFVGEIIARFEKRGLKPVEIKMQTVSRSKAEQFYNVHKDKPFFGDLVSFISSAPTVGVVLEGRDAVATVRRMIGSTKSWEASPGTIRGDFATGLTDNAIHASDSKESFEWESKTYFS
jgi:nucleoside-diphosphate kinase